MPATMRKSLVILPILVFSIIGDPSSPSTGVSSLTGCKTVATYTNVPPEKAKAIPPHLFPAAPHPRWQGLSSLKPRVLGHSMLCKSPLSKSSAHDLSFQYRCGIPSRFLYFPLSLGPQSREFVQMASQSVQVVRRVRE